jgi:preprotein translocase subunit SecA
MLARQHKPFTFFSKPQDLSLEQAKVKLLNQLDFGLFQKDSLKILQIYGNEESSEQWQLFCKHLNSFSGEKAEQMMLMQTAFQCLFQPLEAGELAQLITLSRHLKAVEGRRMLSAILTAEVLEKERILSHYLRIFQLLLDLHEEAGVFKIIEDTLPNLSSLLEKLQITHENYLAKKYPEDNLDGLIQRFAQQSDLVEFPLMMDELQDIKQDYLAIKEITKTLTTMPQSVLQEQIKHYGAVYYRSSQETASDHLSAKHHIIAILTETIRRQYNILPYSTQILSLLALINTPEQLKGRIGQIKTGEGKSTIVAMLSAFMACQGLFVDVVTSSGYLAIRDCKKYQPFYKKLGLSASHISHKEPKQKHFHAQILFGTNTDFEFAFLRDGLYNMELRYSRRFDGELIKRSFEAVIIDEVDNLFLDTALSSAQMGIRDHRDLVWIYQPIWKFVSTQAENVSATPQVIQALRKMMHENLTQNQAQQLAQLKDEHLRRWFNSAHTACFKKQLGQDYIVEAKSDDPNTLEVKIVDYANTGRINEGSQWQHGVHQYIQLKENLPLSRPTKTAASISHPAYFNLYQYILGLTGTMGEAIERKEIQEIYKVASFDVPPHIPSQRKRAADFILNTVKDKWAKILEQIQELKKQKMPVLVLFKTIKESNLFSHYLAEQNIKHQLLNETQREAEDYLVDQAGEPGMITVATNTAGRGTDIRLAPESKKAGGLQMIFTFYPDNLRVEGQGFGRAGRQGQPGRCWMVLSKEDENIKSSKLMSSTLAWDLIAELRHNEYLDDALKTVSDSSEYIPALQYFLNSLRKKYTPLDVCSSWLRVHKSSSQLDNFPDSSYEECEIDFNYSACYQQVLTRLKLDMNSVCVEIDNIMKELHKEINTEISLKAVLDIHEASHQIDKILLQIKPDITPEKLADFSLNLAQISVEIDKILLQFSLKLIDSIETNKLDALLEKCESIRALYKKIDDLIMQFLITSHRYHKKINAAETESFRQKQIDEIKNALIERVKESPKHSIEILNQLRTSRIQDESKQRSECSKQEQLYFSQLQDFFIQMENVYLACQTQEFKTQIIQYCQSYSYVNTNKTQIKLNKSQIKLDETHPEWQILKEITKSMVAQTTQGKDLDWTAFSQPFITVYLTHIRDLWASYYSKLKDALEVDQRESVYKQIEPYLSNPIEMAFAHLDQLLSFGLNKEHGKMQERIQDNIQEMTQEETIETRPRLR